MIMIASDGNAFEKVEVESFNIFAGERFDFVLAADKPVGNYWIRARGLADCGNKRAHQVGDISIRMFWYSFTERTPLRSPRVTLVHKNFPITYICCFQCFGTIKTYLVLA